MSLKTESLSGNTALVLITLHKERESGYHRRSLAETMIFRFKTIFGNTCSRRTFNNQAAELLSARAALNRMTHLGMPDSDVLNP